MTLTPAQILYKQQLEKDLGLNIPCQENPVIQRRNRIPLAQRYASFLQKRKAFIWPILFQHNIMPWK